MGRALKGSTWDRAGRFHASLPVARGSRRRVQAGFDREGDRDAWLAAGIAALQAGQPLAAATRFDGASLNDSPAEAGSAELPPFEELAHGWLDEYYGRLRRGDAERERAARQKVRDYLIPAFAGPIPSDAVAARARLVAFVRRLSAEPEWCDAGDGTPTPDRELTLAEAADYCGRSVAARGG